MTMTNEQLEEAVVRYLAAYEDMVKEGERKSAERRAFFGDFEFVTSTYKKLPDLSPALIAWRRAQADSVLIIRQLWAERDQHRAVMAQAKAAIDDLRGTIDRGGIGAWSSRSPQAIAAMQALAALESMGV